jgi:hypothetical protein
MEATDVPGCGEKEKNSKEFRRKALGEGGIQKSQDRTAQSLSMHWFNPAPIDEKR